MALAGVIAFVMLLFFLFNLGRLMVERERTRMRTDVTVMSGAVIYARCLNLYNFLKKADTASDTLSNLPWAGWVFSIINKFVAAAKKGIKNFGPYGTLAATELVAYNNQLVAVPYWNVKDFFDVSKLGKGLKPDLNFDNNEQQSQSSGSGDSGGGSEDRYSYRRQSSGETVELEKGQVGEDKQGGAKGRSRDKKTGKFVKKEKGQADGEHSLTIVTMNLARDKESGVGGWKELPYFYSIARARVSGGNFDLISTDSMKWGCFLAPVRVKESPAASLNISEIPTTGLASVDTIIIKANLAIAEARQWINRVPAILH